MISKAQSFLWGFMVSLIGLFSPVVSLIVFLALYLLYLKEKDIKVWYYVIGFFTVLILILVLFGTLVGIAIFGGV